MAELGLPGVCSPVRGQSDEDPAAQDHDADHEPRGEIGLRAGGVDRAAKAGLANDEQPDRPEPNEPAGGAEKARPAADQPRPDGEPGDERDRREEEGQSEQRAQHEACEEQRLWSHDFPHPAAVDRVSVRSRMIAVKAKTAPHDRQIVTSGPVIPAADEQS
jgi:hypothetical protein